MDKFMAVLKKVLESVSAIFFVCALVILTSNVISRLITDSPIAGVYELVGLAGLLFGASSIVTCAMLDGHVRVDILVTRLKGVPRLVQIIIVEILELLYYVVVAYGCWQMGVSKLLSDEVSDTLEIPLGEFRLYVAVCFILAALVKVSFILGARKKVKEESMAAPLSEEEAAVLKTEENIE